MTDKKAQKGINDSDKAKVHYTQELFFTKNAEAERIVKFFNKHYGFHLRLAWKKKTSSVMGQINYNEGRITLYVGGDSIATLLHEIAHYVDYVCYRHAGHGSSFHKAQNEVIDIFDLHAHKLILDSEPTLYYHATKIIENAKMSDREVEDELTAYVLLAEMQHGRTLDAEILLDIIVDVI